MKNPCHLTQLSSSGKVPSSTFAVYRLVSFSFPHDSQPNRSFSRYDPSRVPSLPAQDSKRKRLLVAQESNRGSLWAHIKAIKYERGSNMEANNHSDSPCWNNDTASRKGLQSQSSHMVNSTLAQQLSQQYFASLMQPPSTGLRDAQPRSVTERVGRVEFNVARNGTGFLPQIHFPRYPTPTPPIPPTPPPPCHDNSSPASSNIHT